MILLFEYAECFLFGMLAATIFFAVVCRRGWLYCPRCEHRDNFYKALKNVKDDKEIIFHGDDFPVIYKHKKHQADWLEEANKTIEKLNKQAKCNCEVYETCPVCRDQGDQL